MHGEGKKRKRSRAKGRGGLERLSSFTRCSRRVFLYAYVTALTIHLFHVEKFLVAFLRVSQRAFRPKRFLFQLPLISAI